MIYSMNSATLTQLPGATAPALIRPSHPPAHTSAAPAILNPPHTHGWPGGPTEHGPDPWHQRRQPAHKPLRPVLTQMDLQSMAHPPPHTSLLRLPSSTSDPPTLTNCCCPRHCPHPPLPPNHPRPFFHPPTLPSHRWTCRAWLRYLESAQTACSCLELRWRQQWTASAGLQST